jgi:hypothetical protein
MILGTTRAVRAFAYPQPADLRKGYNGLFGLVKTGLGRDPMSGELSHEAGARNCPCYVARPEAVKSEARCTAVGRS